MKYLLLLGTLAILGSASVTAQQRALVQPARRYIDRTMKMVLTPNDSATVVRMAVREALSRTVNVKGSLDTRPVVVKLDSSIVQGTLFNELKRFLEDSVVPRGGTLAVEYHLDITAIEIVGDIQGRVNPRIRRVPAGPKCSTVLNSINYFLVDAVWQHDINAPVHEDGCRPQLE